MNLMFERMLMKPKVFVLSLVALVMASCNLPASATPGPQFETPVVTVVSTIPLGGVVTLNNVSMTLPLGVAKDAQTEMVSANTDTGNSPWWEIAPAHLKFTLTGYQLQDKFLEPTITVYPADEYAKLDTIAAQQIEKLKAILAGGPVSKEAMPLVPYFNAGPAFASHMQVINFKNGRGVRMVTQYDQYPAPVNNHELFYHFQGLTADGKYYVVAVLPVTASILAENEKPESPVPSGGVQLPPGGGPDQAYYESVTKALDAMYEDSFNPSIFQLDALIQSITVAS
jgi:hypothetical protein